MSAQVRSPPLTPDQKQEILDLRSKRIQIKEIARRLKVRPKQVAGFLFHRGHTLQSLGANRVKIEAVRLARETTKANAARVLGVDRSTIANWARAEVGAS